MKTSQKSYRTSRFLLAGISSILFNFCLTSVPALAQVARAKAWVWANLPTTGSYTPSSGYQYNSSGATNQATRLGVGQYRVNFPGLGTGSGTVHVSSYGGNHHCKVVNWGPSGTIQQVRVNCFTPNGVAVDGRFTALFYKESRGSIWTDAYLWANQPTAVSYTPSSSYQWNSKGTINTVSRLGTGRYQATLPSLNIVGGTVLVTAYGSTSERCKVVGWYRSGSNTLVNVNCFNSSGNLVDTTYTLSYMTDVALGIRTSEDTHYGGYVWANSPTAISYTPSLTYQLNNTNQTNSITRNSIGTYTVRFPNLKPFNRTTAKVTAYGSGSEYCTVSNWFSDGSGGTNVNVKCFTGIGTSVDTRFTLIYLTNEGILF